MATPASVRMISPPSPPSRSRVDSSGWASTTARSATRACSRRSRGGARGRPRRAPSWPAPLARAPGPRPWPRPSRDHGCRVALSHARASPSGPADVTVHAPPKRSAIWSSVSSRNEPLAPPNVSTIAPSWSRVAANTASRPRSQTSAISGACSAHAASAHLLATARATSGQPVTMPSNSRGGVAVASRASAWA